MKIKPTPGEKLFDIFNIIFMFLIILVTLYPMYFVVCASLSKNVLFVSHPGFLWKPLGLTFGAYARAFQHPLLLNGYKNTLIILAVSLPLDIVMTVFCGYVMAAKNMMLKKFLIPYIMFTMFFSGGLIPSFLNQKQLGLYNNLWALIIPGALSVYNAIIAKTAIEGIPDSLIESAYIDGANDIVIMFRIVIPLIMPTIAVLLLYYGVGHWNSWFPATIYLKEQKLMPLQAILRAILVENSGILNAAAADADIEQRYTETIKYALIVISTLPILAAYPFLQRYFVKGVMIGAVKG